jgi:hypothetical protein
MCPKRRPPAAAPVRPARWSPRRPQSDGIPTRTLVLWGILLLGALALGAMAWVLMKQTRQPPAQGQ